MAIKLPVSSTSPFAPGSRRAGAVAAAVTCAALIGACGSSNSSSSSSTAAKTNLDTTRVARSIAQSILAQRHLKAKVVCPVTVPQEVGKTFECIATTTGTGTSAAPVKTPFLVTVETTKGYVTYVGK